MSSACARSILLITVGLSFYLRPAFAVQEIDQWNGLVSEGENAETGDHPNYVHSVDCYGRAATLAKEKSLPGKYFAEALCRLAAAEVRGDRLSTADRHCQQIMELHAEAIAKRQLDPELEPLMLKLADGYMAHSTVQTCLERAFDIRTQVLAKSFPDQPELAASAYRLADYYDDHDQPELAISVLKKLEKIAGKSMAVRSNYVALNLLNTHLAFSYEIAGRYSLAKQAMLQAQSFAKLNQRTYGMTLPSYFCFLGMNALAQNQTLESRQYFSKATSAAAKFKRQKSGQVAVANGITCLLPIVRGDIAKKNRLLLAEGELKGLLQVEKSIPDTSQAQNLVVSLLLDVLAAEQKHQERNRLAASERTNEAVAINLNGSQSMAEKQWLQSMELAAAKESRRRTPRKLGAKELEATSNSPNIPNSDAQKAYLEALKLGEQFGPQSTEALLTLSELQLSYLRDHKLAIAYPYLQRLLSIANKCQYFEFRQGIDQRVLASLGMLASAYEIEAKQARLIGQQYAGTLV
jgi:hypothetical protein